MAETILIAIVTAVSRRICNVLDREVIGRLVGREVSLLVDLQKNLRSIEGTLTAIKAVLLDAERKQAQDHQLRDWLGKLKDVCYDIEDVLEEFEFKASRSKSSIRKVCHCFSSSNPVEFSSEMAHKVQETRERLDQIADDRQKFNLSNIEVTHVFPERETDHFIKPSDVIIGRNDEKEKVISFLMEPTAENVSVMPIVGIGGLGKTTLTKLVYNDDVLEGHFQLKMWVCVSDDFDLTRLMKEIIHSAIGESCKELNAKETEKRLQEILAEKKFLLVLDDVWNDKPTKWMDLKNVLMNGINGSKIIVSTRSKRVAEIMRSTNVLPLVLKGLSPEHSLSLFKTYAFKDGRGEDFPNLIRIGNEILEKCNGVPLAVRTLGSLLYANTDENEWERIKGSDIWQLDQEKEDILPALKLSYDHLPDNMKPCFAYLSLFPKDYIYDAEYTVQYWMAYGLLASANQNEELEDVGLRYIKELYSRGFVEDFQELGFYYQFRMHDLMHDLATSVTGNECSIVNFSSQNVDLRVRHFSIYDTEFSGKEVPAFILNKTRKVRSIIFPRKQYEPISASFIRTCISRFRYLRVLYLNSILFEELPNSVGTLTHLRCLDLSWNYYLKELPRSICELQNLQTLRLRACTRIMKLPDKFRKMISLRYLEVTTQESRLPGNGIGRLSSLQYLFLCDCSKLTSLFGRMQGLSGLRILYIRNCSLVSLPDSLKYLTRLEKLVLWNCVELNLKMETREEDHQLRLRLRVFIAYGLASLVDLPQVILQGSANTLQYMRIAGCHKLEALPDSMQNLTSLQKLLITDCSALSYLPEGIRSLPALKELNIQSCPRLTE